MKTPARAAGNELPFRFVIGAGLLGFACVLLPTWDALDRYSLMSALAGSGLGSSSGASMPTGAILYPLLGVLLAVGARKRAAKARSVAALLVCVGLWTGYYALSTAYRTARTRSHAIDTWNLCEDPEHTPSGHGAYVSRYKSKSSFGGPHLDNGDPCVSRDERRDVHLAQHGDGDLADGLAQIMKRFPKDRSRVIFGTLAVVAAFIAGAWLLRTSPAKSPRQDV